MKIKKHEDEKIEILYTLFQYKNREIYQFFFDEKKNLSHKMLISGKAEKKSSTI